MKRGEDIVVVVVLRFIGERKVVQVCGLRYLPVRFSLIFFLCFFGIFSMCSDSYSFVVLTFL